MQLFPDTNEHLILPNAELIYVPDFFSLKASDAYFNSLQNDTPWQHDDIKVFGKTYKQPRLTALYGEDDRPYSYSNITMQPHSFSSDLKIIKDKVEAFSDATFNSVLLNWYRDGQDSNGWHADNEASLGQNPIIASVTFGSERPFHFAHRTLKDQRHRLILKHGSLLIMKGEMQHYWLHQIAKTKKDIGGRINLTFRKLI
ncbi:alpha-ketoglutarate-dependent dioxygenase AlkB [Winogradskyella maritima]|uniref:Alpha-ketoglutarate-dependent dioxygenase AlkB family protein n=1 Tax=Winogradskyella maritima TaxID=1517766 RepID=A0ABV8AN32_9FLAO|nr:alpha-ketoglutarate-dependent dioxygenase AlkB [Winogradskyella maritima]